MLSSNTLAQAFNFKTGVRASFSGDYCVGSLRLNRSALNQTIQPVRPVAPDGGASYCSLSLSDPAAPKISLANGLASGAAGSSL